MGIKFLNLQMMLQLMGNHMACLHIRSADRPAPEETIKLIKWDGTVNIYHRPIHVSDVLIDYPNHLVCRSDSFYIGQKIPPLSHSDQLHPAHKYFLLPLHCFQTVLSFVSIASFVTTSNSTTNSLNPLLKKAAACKAFDFQKSPSGCLRIRVSDEFISRLMEDNGDSNDFNKTSMKKNSEEGKSTSSRVCNTPQLQKDYRVLVGNSGQWKPKLETIREKEKRKLSSFGIKKRKKSHSKKSTVNIQPPPVPKPSSKAKIKIKLRK